MKTDFILRPLGDTSFEIVETETLSDLIHDAIAKYFITKVDTKEKLIRDGLIKIGWLPASAWKQSINRRGIDADEVEALARSFAYEETTK